MAYVLGQYNKNKNVADDAIFMTYITTGTAKRKQSAEDDSPGGSAGIFYNECVQTISLQPTSNYYFHGKIKRMVSDQVFYIKLTNFENPGTEEPLEQYIKTVTVAKGDPDEWVDVEFIFNPLITFDTILFELQRTVEDYKVETRCPIIIYEELSIINNIIARRIADGVQLIKIGVQSRPGLLMCINGEEIRTNRSGIYELKEGLVMINFFSVVNAANETSTILDTTIAEINATWNAAELIPDVDERTAAKMAIGSRCLFGNPKTRTINSFTLDYLYREE